MTNDAELGRRARRARENATAHLLGHLAEEGCWRGQLAGSALATAVGAFAWIRTDADAYREPINRALDWLTTTINEDGGWGDTPESPSNLATTLLAWSALTAASDARYAEVIAQAGRRIEERCGGRDSEAIVAAVLAFYGKDRTFSVPILTLCALAGTLGPDGWRHVPQLPFELAALPHTFFRWIRLPVVSYAMPALIAMGLVRHRLAGDGFAPRRLLREKLTATVLDKLRAMQPESGGFLEAAPLIGFVVMSLSACGLSEHPVAKNGAKFLCESQRDDGALPIDTDLATWLTTHAVRALGEDTLALSQQAAIRYWLLSQQHVREHPFTHADPGGWAWTDLSGGVPDADDTAGTLLALHRLGAEDSLTRQAGRTAVGWLLALQNRDGGFPTFCRGWGTLPFDRSCPDITAHALQALLAWRREMGTTQAVLDMAAHKALEYLRQSQSDAGAWLPLWFGNQHTERMENPVFGTAQVCVALAAVVRDHECREAEPMLEKGLSYLASQQNEDGGWGGMQGAPSSIEETSLALSALSVHGLTHAVRNGAAWLVEVTEDGTRFPRVPIGLYFSSLWYDELLYPVVFGVNALRAVEACLPSGMETA